jgi:bis(5'-nucleosyl)-tetraphosphatase (symmetrical)
MCQPFEPERIVSTYAVGDIQGCFDTLMALLTQVHFKPETDTLWCAGDLINRGPKNVETLQYLMALPNLKVALGNHDLHFLALAKGIKTPTPSDTIGDLLTHPDREQFVAWLQKQPLLICDDVNQRLMVHAGLPDVWSLDQVKHLAHEIEQQLRGASVDAFLNNMYGDTPAIWSDTLTTPDRLRLATNFFTRLRFYKSTGELELIHKTETAPEGFTPWFNTRHASLADYTLIFGHWAALGGVRQERLIGLDTGAVWGRHLTALRLEDGIYFTQPAASA